MKKYIVFVIFCLSASSFAQIVTIPDANFKAKLLSASPSNQIASTEIPNIPFGSTAYYGGSCSSYNSIDTNNDGEIQVSEASAIKFLNIYRSGTDAAIYDCTGISSFVNLIYFRFDYHNVTNFNVSGLSNLTYLQCNGNEISNLNVDGLSNLRFLDCGWNQLSTLNLNSLVNLENLKFYSNNISSVDLLNLNLLEYIICDTNPIFLSNITFGNPSNLKYLSCNGISSTSLDLSIFSNLNHLFCGQNQLTSLDLSSLNSLMTLSCPNNQITSLNLSNLGILTRLDCSFNPILFTNINFGASTNSIFEVKVNGIGATNINFSVLPNLSTLECYQNQLTNLDLSDNYSLRNLSCNTNNLISINIKNGAISNNTNSLSIGNNPNLAFICADTGELSFVQQIINSSANINCVVNSYCSFTPGGNYNTITGSMLFDANNDGCDASDLPQPNIKININDGTNQGAIFTNNSGNYNFYTQAGSFVLTPNIENPTWFNVSPTTATIPFANNNNNTSTQNFCISANGIHPDLEIVIAPIVPARPGFNATYQVLIKNKGNLTLSGQFILNFNDELLDFLDAGIFPNEIISGTLMWNFTDLQPFETLQTNVSFNVNAPTDVPPVNIGDELNFQVVITPTQGDEIPQDNVFAYNQTVVGSYDPNDIICLEGDIVPSTEIGEYLHYIINFENTGNSQAENIVVRVEIDPTKFDVNSLQMLNTSHNAYIRQNGNVVEFIFQNIALESGGHGNVLLKIKTKDNLPNNDTVTKQAAIYFDYNAPIETNMANTTFQFLSSGDFEVDDSISVYPNPTLSLLNFNCNTNIKSIQLYDVQGRLLQTQIVNDTNTSIDVSDKSNGIYFAKITSEVGVKVEKIIKE